MANDMSRSVKINEFKSKGLEWCATKLFYARKENESLRNNKQIYKNETYQLRHEASECRVVKAINARMANLLIENGIRPVRLRITYKDCDCEHCENNGEIEGQEWNCYGCGEENDDGEVFREKEIIITTTESFYSYELAGNKLAGITGLFEAKDYDVIKVVDMNTNDVLYEKVEG